MSPLDSDDRKRYSDFQIRGVRPKPSPLGRRERIREALENGDWATAATELHTARATAEYRMVSGITSWTDYVETIPLSRMHAWRLCLIAATDSTRVCYTLRGAYAEALTRRRESAAPEPS